MANSITKRLLARELSERAGQPVKDVLTILNELAEIAYREAANGFIIPGICKLSVTRRQARRFRHPSTGQLFMIAAHDAVTAAPLKKCRCRSVAIPDNLLVRIDESEIPTAAPRLGPLPGTPSGQRSDPGPQAETPAPFPPIPENEDDVSIVFCCEHCGNTVAASIDMANLTGECPFCNDEIRIPPFSPAQTRATPPSEPPGDNGTAIMGFVTFVCHACNQEIEAPYGMIGIEAACPSCGSVVHIPAEDAVLEPAGTGSGSDTGKRAKPDMGSMTIRIDLSDVN